MHFGSDPRGEANEHLVRVSFRHFAANSSVKGKFTNGGAPQGIGIYQSGQPFSVIDYSGAVGSLYYCVSNGITNPIVPLAPGFTPQSALTGQVGVKWIGAESIVLHSTCSAVGRDERRDPVERSLPGGRLTRRASLLGGATSSSNPGKNDWTCPS